MKRTYPALNLRNRHFFVVDILTLSFIPALALTLRVDGLNWWPSFGPALIVFTLAALLLKLPFFYRMGLYRRYWRYTGPNDVTLVAICVGVATAGLIVLVVVTHPILAPIGLALYLSVPVIDGFLTFLIVGGSRFGVRGLYHWYRHRQSAGDGRRVLVVGAGEAGSMVVNEMRANPQLNMEPVVFVDDDSAKVHSRIQDLPVLGTSEDIPNLVGAYQIQQIVVAMPSAPLRRQQEIITTCKQTGIATHNLAGIYEILAGHKTLSHFPQIDVNRLLRRPAEIILLGRGENSIFESALGLHLSYPDLVLHSVIADVRDRQRVDWEVEKHRPDIIFHAAAHKHVPFMEAHVKEAVINNVLGTRNVLEAAERYGVERFVLISSDKAVNPTSIMGATKRLAELLVGAAARRTGQAYMAVRFGNVLGSRGSVIPVFQRQIAAGGPVTVTHPDMRRYFMTIPEAVQLVLQAGVLAQGGEVFVLDMGQPVRILDLASDLIKLSGLEPGRDIKIAYNGIRPGEKLSEELFLEGEDYRRTKHPKIFVTPNESNLDTEALEHVVLELINLAQNMQSLSASAQLRSLILETCHYIDQFQPRLSVPGPTVAPEASPPPPAPSYAARPLSQPRPA
jgi:FlaA1/EpsC-like NDP-sugar epimerase